MMRVIDIETTGTDPASDSIVEIASVDLHKSGICNEMQTFVNPGRPIPPASSAVHHIIDEDVAGYPPLPDAIGRFTGADWYVAHNAEFEAGFLTPHLGGNWVCTYKCALRIWPDFPSHSNQSLRYHLGLVSPFGRHRQSLSPHRALDDCIVTAAIFLEITKAAKWSAIQRWSSEPALQTRFSWGKHRGERWDAVPDDYLRWILDKLVDDKSALFSAAYWLDQRTQAS